MGGSQSVRKITIDNNSADVIKVSQSVVERLKNGSRTDGSKNPEETGHEQAKPSVRPPSVPPGFSHFAPYPYPYPAASIPVQEEIQKEVDKTNAYWKQRMAKLENIQDEASKRMHNEYEKTMKEFENVLPELGAKKEKKVGDVSDLNQVRDQLIKCYKEHKNRSLNCASEVENFNKCFEEKRALQRQRS